MHQQEFLVSAGASEATLPRQTRLCASITDGGGLTPTSFSDMFPPSAVPSTGDASDDLSMWADVTVPKADPEVSFPCLV